MLPDGIIAGLVQNAKQYELYCGLPITDALFSHVSSLRASNRTTYSLLIWSLITTIDCRVLKLNDLQSVNEMLASSDSRSDLSSVAINSRYESAPSCPPSSSAH